jgi:hypothetical protein
LQSADEESRDTLSVSEITKIYILILYQWHGSDVSAGDGGDGGGAKSNVGWLVD